MKNYYNDFELPEGEFPRCKYCKKEGFFSDEFGMVNDKIYCISCIEKFDLKDKNKLQSEIFEKEIKKYFSKHYKIIVEKYKFKSILIDDWDKTGEDYIYYSMEAISELSYLFALKEIQNLKEDKKETCLNSVLIKYEQFVDNLTKVSISEIEEYYLINKPSTNLK